jgi:hypothetical protein
MCYGIVREAYIRTPILTNFVLDEDMQLIQKSYHRDDLMRKVREVLANGKSK